MSDLFKKFFELKNKKINYKKKTYEIINAKTVGSCFVLVTNRSTLTFLESELPAFFDEILIEIEANNIQEIEEKKKNMSTEVAIVDNTNYYPAEIKKQIFSVRDMNNRICDSLESLFNQINENPTDELMKKAKVMQDTANSIVNVQVSTLKYLTQK